MVLPTEFDRIPEWIYTKLNQRGITKKVILFAMHADRDAEENNRDSYLFFTSDRLTVLSVEPDPSDKGTEPRGDADFREYPTAGLERLIVEERTSTSVLIAAAKDGSFLRLAAMTNFCRASAQLFARYGNRLLAGETNIKIEPDDEPGANCCPKCGMRYPDVNQKVCPHCMQKSRSLTRMLFFMKKYKLQMVGAFLTLCLSVAFSIIGPYFSSGFFYDQVLTEGGGFFGQLGLVLALVVATRALMYFSIMINSYVTSKISVLMIYDLRKTIFGAIERLSLKFFSGRHTGGLMNQVTSDTGAIYEFFCNSIPYFLMCLVQIIIVVVLLFLLQPLMAALVFVLMPVYAFLVYWQHNRNRKLRAVQYNHASSMNSHLSDALTGARVVKAFSKEGEELRRFGVNNKRLAASERRLSVFNNFVSPFAGMILFASNIISLGVGGYLVIKGELTYGELLTFVAYVNIAYTPLSFFVDFLRTKAYYSNAASRLFEILDARPEITERKDPLNPDIRGKVTFRNVDFSYDQNRRILENVSFEIEAGKVLGVVGHSGAGKSTIVNLLMRLYETNNGEILIDDVNVRDLAFEKLYGSIAIVSQETYLFVGTVLENIRYACPEATYEEIIAASRIAGAHEFIMKMPDGYETKIGLGYQDLSGGEKQRVSIARAILRDPKILILDEATAAMDTETERMIQDALSRLTVGKTTIMIAHRLSTLRDADHLIVIEKGKVAESGTHAELLEKPDGVYHKLYTLQEEALRNAGIAE